MKSKFFILFFFMLFMMVGCSKEKSIRIAAVQMKCQLGELDANLLKAKIIRNIGRTH